MQETGGAAFDGQGPSVAIILSGIGAGGTERIVSMLASQLVRGGWRVTIITPEAADAQSYYPLDGQVRVVRLGLPAFRYSRWRGTWVALRRVFAMRRVLAGLKPDVVLSFLTRTNVQALIATLGMDVPVIVSERNNPLRQDVGPRWRLLRDLLYPRAYGLVVMTKGALSCFPPAQRRRSWVVPNFATLPDDLARQGEGRTLAAVGRLVPQKGFDLLLNAFAQIAPRFPGWTLVVWGEGPDREALENLADRLGLQGQVRFPGVSPKPAGWIESTDIFVLSSRFEGWGIVLLEALAAGLPCVSFDCHWGPAEMIAHDRNGLLVGAEDVDGLAGAMARLMQDQALCEALGEAARQDMTRFAPAKVMALWEEVLRDALGSQRPQPTSRLAPAA